VIVNAGPGTGKTHVLVERFFHLVAVEGLAIHDVLMVTFTRKAAREMRERLARRLLEAGRLESALELETAWVTNFHGLCYRLLRENALAASFDPASRIIDQVEAAEVSSELRREFLESTLVQEALAAEEKGDPIPTSVIDRLSRSFETVVGALGRAQENLLDAAHLAPLTATALTALRTDPEARDECAAQDFFVRALPEIEAAYARAKEEETLVDYVDLQTRAIALLESKGGETLRKRFRAILVDEFQDTNFAQLKILELLAKPAFANVMVVGDERQAIYSFRGARVENLRELPKKVRAVGGESLALDLYESFRSYQEILDAATKALPEGTVPARALVAAALGSSERDPLSRRPVVRTLKRDTKEDEAEKIAEEILALRGQRVSAVDAAGTRREVELTWGSFAILMRGVGSAKAYEEALRARKIPYRTFGGTGFYDRREILDLLAYLRAIANPYDGLALVRILQNPPFGLSDRSLHGLANVQFTGSETAHIEKDAHENLVIPSERLKPFDALRRALDEPELARSLGIEDQALDRLARLRTFLERSVQRRGAVPVSRLLLDVLVETGYGKLLLADEEHGPLEALRRRKNVERLLRLARRFEERSVYGSLEELVSYLERAIEEEVKEEEEGVEADERVVNVMTVDQAKGKEWPVVFVAGVTDKSWPMRGFPQDVVFFEGAGAVLRRSVVGVEGDAKVDYPETQLHAKLAAGTAAEKEAEERRILFVGMTRAKNRLVVSGYGKHTKYLDRVAAPLVGTGREEPVPVAVAVETPPEAVVVADLEKRVEAALAGVAEVAAAVPPQGPPRAVHLSFSHIDVFDTCPLKYKFTFVTPLPGVRQSSGLKAKNKAEGAERADLSPTELGTVFHDALERWAKEEGPLDELVQVAASERGGRS
jgi:DNA helicase-2/ATP-dependent DNA helicase PcrA